jgi:transcriptional regulator with AAA-type ATPase domain/tetratricopeptide (TPR) repeat protein
MEPLAELLGQSPEIRAVKETVARLLQRQASAGRLPPVLIQGETGTGKGLLARVLHDTGPRRGGPFVDLNCAAIPETLLEAELFGYERGAFTDARQAKPGLFQAAHRGTLFLDEIGLLPEGLQSKLLTVIEERSVRRLGSTRNEPVDVWIVTASNEELTALTRQGRFREDLYHRLAVLTVALPPLRERGADILLLAEHFLARACADYGLARKSFAPDAQAALLAYPWPGNIRELANTMERVALLAEAAVVTAGLLGLPEAGGAPRPGAAALEEDAVARLERERDELGAALQASDWNISRAAQRLGIPRNTLRYRIAKHRLRPDAARPAAPARAARAAAPVPSRQAAPAAPGPAPSSGGALRWERRRLTFLAAALTTPPEAAEPGPDTTRALEILVEKVQSFGGRVEELTGAGLVAVFGLDALEDPARRAGHAAMAMQKIAERARRANTDRPAVRIALHTEQVAVGQRGGVAEIDADARRHAWGPLETLTRAGEPGAIRVSAATAPFLTRRFELVPEDAGPAEAAAAYRLVGLDEPGAGRRLAAFVGRRDELTLLTNRLAAARRGHGQVVGIGGEAGIGKSRLLYEFRRSLSGEPVTYLEGQCASYATALPYTPLVEILRQTCGFTDVDGADAIVEKVRGAAAAAGVNPETAAPYLLHLLGVREGTERLADLSPEAVQARMFEVMWQMSLEGSQRRPLVLAIEDLHWIDKASEAYLDSLVESLPGAPILLLLTYRPGYQPRWLTKSYATQIGLSPLAPEESVALVRSVLPPQVLADDVVRRMVETADGNPFFLEELARTVDEQAGEPGTSPVPGTIEEVLLARIDRLPEAARRCLQTAAVLGRESPLRLLRAMGDPPEDLEASLRELVRLEFLYDRPGDDEAVYVFKHALTREVARESLSPARRLALHAAAGRALEAVYGDRLDTVADRLAYHYSKAKLADKAVEHLGRFAEKAARSYAHVEAAVALRDALDHAERLPPDRRAARRLDLVLRLAHCLSFLGRFPETRDLLLAEQEHVEPGSALAGPYHFWLAHTYSYLGDYARATEHAQVALEEASRTRDAATMGRAGVVLAQEHYWAGQPLHGIARGRRAAELLAEAGERWWLGLAHWVVGVNYVIIGAFGLALDAEAQALAVGEALGDARIQSYATWSTGWIHAITGAWDLGIDACQRALARSPDPLNTVVALGHLGYAHLEKGDARAAIPLLEDALDRMERFGFRQLQGRFTTFLGEAHLLEGRLAEARELVSLGVRLSAEARYWYGLGWARHALGRIAHAAGDLGEAEQELTEAVATFARIHARFMVGRTRLSLAQVAHARHDAETAASHLGEAHALFRVLHVPHWLDRTAALGQEWSVALADETAQPALAVVRRGEAELFEMLRGHLDALNLGGVIWDRRVGDRRRRQASRVPDRRGQDRRRPLPPTWDTLGFLLSP